MGVVPKCGRRLNDLEFGIPLCIWCNGLMWPAVRLSRQLYPMPVQGGLVLVNGVVNPVLKASKSLIRLRLLNGSNATTYHLSFDDQREFHIIASDGGLLEEQLLCLRNISGSCPSGMLSQGSCEDE